MLCHCFDLTGSHWERLDFHWPAAVSIGSYDIDCSDEGGGTSHRGWYYRKRGRQRLHTHTHKYKYRHTLAPSFCPLQSGGSPSSYAPMFPRGGQTCCAIRSSSHPFSPPPSLLSPNLIISHALVSPSLLPTAIPPGLGILKVFS